MEPFITHTGKVIPLNRSNINTDDITPARFLKTIKRTGFADILFANWRFLDNTSTPNPEFPLNQSRYAQGSILLTGDNFGCGSSREHAPWALRDYGIRSIIASSFADIFYNNCFNNGILPIVLAKDVIDSLFQEEQKQCPYELIIDLASQQITTPTRQIIPFTIDTYRKDVLLKGLDTVEWILSHSEEIAVYEEQHKRKTPWIFLTGKYQKPGAEKFDEVRS